MVAGSWILKLILTAAFMRPRSAFVLSDDVNDDIKAPTESNTIYFPADEDLDFGQTTFAPYVEAGVSNFPGQVQKGKRSPALNEEKDWRKPCQMIQCNTVEKDLSEVLT